MWEYVKPARGKRTTDWWIEKSADRLMPIKREVGISEKKIDGSKLAFRIENKSWKERENEFDKWSNPCWKIWWWKKYEEWKKSIQCN